jgi:hypothetical protein
MGPPGGMGGMGGMGPQGGPQAHGRQQSTSWRDKFAERENTDRVSPWSVGPHCEFDRRNETYMLSANPRVQMGPCSTLLFYPS